MQIYLLSYDETNLFTDGQIEAIFFNKAENKWRINNLCPESI